MANASYCKRAIVQLDKNTSMFLLVNPEIPERDMFLRGDCVWAQRGDKGSAVAFFMEREARFFAKKNGFTVVREEFVEV